MRKSPPGYRDYAAALGAKGYEVHIVAVLKAKIGDAAIDSGLFSEAVNQTAFWPKINQIRGFCPVSILETNTHVRLPPYTVGYIQSIPTIRETNKFKKQLAKIRDQRIISDWNKKKASLAERIPRFPEFEKFPQRDCFSLRLAQGYRAHLSQVGTNPSEWVAIEVGSHKAMGHG